MFVSENSCKKLVNAYLNAQIRQNHLFLSRKKNSLASQEPAASWHVLPGRTAGAAATVASEVSGLAPQNGDTRQITFNVIVLVAWQKKREHLWNYVLVVLVQSDSSYNDDGEMRAWIPRPTLCGLTSTDSEDGWTFGFLWLRLRGDCNDQFCRASTGEPDLIFEAGEGLGFCTGATTGGEVRQHSEPNTPLNASLSKVIWVDGFPVVLHLWYIHVYKFVYHHETKFYLHYYSVCCLSMQ